MREIIGKKVGMTRVFRENGDFVAVSVIEAGPCPVTALKTEEKDGYKAVQVGFDDKREKLFNKPLLGHFKKAGVPPRRYLREVRQENEIAVGGVLDVDIFKKGERVDVSGLSKAIGFQGAMRRHNFRGGPVTHGQSDRLRAPGSVGSSSYPSRVFKGMRMAGKMGGRNLTQLNLEIVDIIPDQHLILVKGAIPGKKGTFLRIRSTNRGK